jgi:XTP/dITP diphosphohydrolase
MTVWFATGNTHKRDELAAILAPAVPTLTLKIPAEAGMAFAPEESGATFAENALIKARALHRLLAAGGRGGVVIADDSGLCVDALGGRPGVLSARYGSDDGVKLNDAERNLLLLKEMNGAANRRARFVCALVVLYSEERFFLVQETCDGEIVKDIRAAAGGGGFGYDPILCIPALGRTVAELQADEKNRISHRGKAGRAMAHLLAGAGEA